MPDPLPLLQKHSLLQILIELPDGFSALPLGLQYGDLALPCCL